DGAPWRWLALPRAGRDLEVADVAVRIAPAQRRLARRQPEPAARAAVDDRELAHGIAFFADRRGTHAPIERAVARDRERLGELIGAGGDRVAFAVAREALALDDRVRLRGERPPHAEAIAVQHRIAAEDDRALAGRRLAGLRDEREIGRGIRDRDVE